MKDWIMELCPEIAEWQADLIAEQAQREVAAEREACAALMADLRAKSRNHLFRSALTVAEGEIRAKGQVRLGVLWP